MTNKQLASHSESCLASVLVKAATDILIEITAGTILSRVPRGQLEYLVDQCREIERQAKKMLDHD